MSGPKTFEYSLLGDALASVAAESLRQAERENAASRRSEDDRREHARLMREAASDRLAVAKAAAEEAGRRLERLERLTGAPSTMPASRKQPRQDNDADALEALARTLDGEAARLESSLRDSLATAANRMSADALEKFARPKTAAELLDAYAAQAKARQPKAGSGEPEARRERALRILGRLSGEAASFLPREMEALIAGIVSAPDEARAGALELELRLRVQRFNEDRARRESELAQARLAEERSRSAALILDGALHDLGYATDGIENTLFVEGGVAHFNKAEWGDYYVRLRVSPDDRSLNVNMVRERQAGAGDRRAADRAAEESWCTGLPTLMKTLEARGLHLDMRRHLAPGAVPVQEVATGTLPEALKTKAATSGTAPKAIAAPPR